MPHVIVKMYPGRTEEQKIRLAHAIAESLVKIVQCDEEAVSVAVEEIPSEKWPGTVYKPDIIDKEETLYIKPGYNPFKL